MPRLKGQISRPASHGQRDQLVTTERAASRGLVWRQVHWRRPVDPVRAAGVLRGWAADPNSPRLVMEARAHISGVVYLAGAPQSVIGEVEATLLQMLPGTTLTTPAKERLSVTSAARVKASTRHRALRSDDLESSVRAILGALTRVREGEHLVVQLVLGPRRIPLAVPTQSPSSIVAPWWHVALHGNGGVVDSEKRSALRNKVSDHGFACSVRLGVTAPTRQRRRALLLGVLAAIRTSETPGVQLRVVADSKVRFNRGAAPMWWPLRLNVNEALSLTGWPVGEDDLPGQPAAHPRLLPPAPGTDRGRVVAQSTAPSFDVPLTLTAHDALHHTHVVGPTGVGKSVLLGRLIEQDIADGLAVVVIEPKGDLIDDVLAHIPEHRQGEVVVLDPADLTPVGLNPLAHHGQRGEVVADGILTIFKALYAEAWGPRTQDILHACLLTLARRSDASLVMLPLLLTNAGFRRSLTSSLRDPLALEPFWAWYENLSDGERQQAIAPVMNKLRQWLLRPSLRAVLGQREPRFDIRQVFTERKILLVPLRKGIIGAEAASLLGSLVVAELWQATQSRAAIAPERRHPVMVYIDEVQDYLHLPTDLGDALAQARGLGVGFTLAHQFLGQLSPPMRTGVLANARSRICFQLAHEDAVTMAKGHPELGPEDLTSLGQYEVYASLFARGQVTPYASGHTLAAVPQTSDPALLRGLSRDRYGRPLDEIESNLADLITSTHESAPIAGRRRRPQ
jgi:hypothetical protein